MKKIEAMLHPVRFKIIQQFLNGESKTAKVLAKDLPEIPQATLYRQLDTLVKANILLIKEENPIRGTVEKVYMLNQSNTTITDKDLMGLSKGEHLQYFLFFTAQLAKNFEAYLQQGDINYERDGVGYRQVALHLSDEEYLEFVKEMRSVYEKYSKNPPATNRTKRLLSTIILPEVKGGTES